jgi:Cu/Ag efflux pump CusA
MRSHIAAFAVIVFALVSAPAIHLDYAPDLSQPEATVVLEMGAGTDPEELTARWVVPIESAIRSLGDVIATRGEITADSAMITIRFRRGVDERKPRDWHRARVSAASLPLDARLSVAVAPDGARPSVLRDRAPRMRRIADELRGVTGVRDV